MMYKVTKAKKTELKVNRSYEGETLEAKIRRMMNNKEPIGEASPLIYTERKDGVQPDYNPRTDKWDAAIDAMDKVAQAKIIQREDRHKSDEDLAKEGKERKDGKVVKMKPKENKDEGGTQSTQGTDNK